MKVSIIMRTYNRAYVLGEAIESALRQTYSDFEIIVVDDGSVDDTSEIVRQFQSDKIRYIRHDRNRGVSAAGNTGISAARGSLIAHLDSDDLWNSEMLRHLVDVLDHHPEVGAAFCNVEIVRPESISSVVSNMHAFSKMIAPYAGSENVILTSREMYVCLLEEIPIKPTGVIIRRDVLDAVGGYNESWLSGEDWELYLRISKRYGFGYVNRKLATMRIYKDSTLSKFQEEDKVSLLRLALSEKRALRGDREALRAVDRAIARHHNNLGWIYLHSGRRMRGISTYARGFVETGHFPLLMRAALAIIPLSLSAHLKRSLHWLTGLRVKKEVQE